MKHLLGTLVALLLLAPPARLAAQTAEKPQKKDSPEITTDEKVRILEEEVERLKVQKASKTYQSVYGMGPAASAVYRPDEGLSMGGYVEGNGDMYKSRYRPGTGDLERFVLYAGYRFNDWIVFNSELEYEHAGFKRQDVVTEVDFAARTTKTETIEKAESGVEFAYVDFKLKDSFQIRAGLNLVPIGITNFLHEPTTFLSVHRPLTETTIIPSTWRELGVVVHGDIDKGHILYRTGFLTGLDAKRFTAGDWIGEDGSYRGSQATLRDAAFVANVDAKPWEALTIGGTYYAGRSGQGGVKAVTVEDRAVVTLPGAFSTEQSAADAQTYLDTHQRKAHVLVQIMEAHALFRQGPWEARALAARGWMSEADTKAVNRATGENVGRVAQGGYLEVAYNVLSLTKSEQRLLVFLRNERLNTQKETVQRYAGSQDDFLDAGCTRTGNCKTTDMLAQGNRDLGYIPASDPGKELYGVKGTADRTNDRNIWTLGLAYYPHPNIVLKFEYQRNNSMSNYPRDQEYLNPDNHKIDQINFGMGLIL